MASTERDAGSLAIEGSAFVPSEKAPDRVERVTVRIERGVIAEVSPPAGGDLVFDDRFLILPGFIDMHVHCREDATGQHNYKETFRTAGRAALEGGVVAVVDMPNNPLPPDTADRYAQKAALARTSDVDVLCYALVNPRTGPFAPNVPYKIYLSENSGGTDAAVDALFTAFSGQWLSVHAEDPLILKACAKAPTHEERRPPRAEVAAVERLLRRLRANPCLHLHLCHLSLGRTAELVRKAKEDGLPVTGEVCCHHLLLDEKSFPSRYRGYSNVNPPLRTKRDRELLGEALAGGAIDALGTDHAPHLPAEKEAGASGFPGLDIYGAYVTQLLRDLPLSRVAAVTSGFPARFWERFTGERLGRIATGAVGSLSIVGPRPWAGVPRDHFTTQCGWSPYVGREFPGAVEATIVRGLVKYRRGGT